MQSLKCLVSWVLLLAMPPAISAGLSVRVTTVDGQPAVDAVVSVVSPAVAARPVMPPRTYVIDQRKETFIPYVEIFRPGDSVVFHNSDSTRHHVYSFSQIKPFEFVLGKDQSSPPLVLDREGVVAAGCNIHDRMIAHLFVSSSPFIARTDSTGLAKLPDVPSGQVELRVWHPRLRAGTPAITRSFKFDAAAATPPIQVQVALLPDRRQRRERSRYQP